MADTKSISDVLEETRDLVGDVLDVAHGHCRPMEEDERKQIIIDSLNVIHEKLGEVKKREMNGYLSETQRWVDEVCHYRNLAISLGAQPNDMLDKYDRELAEKHIAGVLTDEVAQEARLETAELWRENESLERVAKAARAFEADLSDYCHGKLRDELRAALADITWRI